MLIRNNADVPQGSDAMFRGQHGDRHVHALLCDGQQQPEHLDTIALKFINGWALLRWLWPLFDHGTARRHWVFEGPRLQETQVVYVGALKV